MTDQDLLSDVQIALVEPPDGGASFPSDLWLRDEVLLALNTRQRQLLRDTQLIVSTLSTAVLANANPITLPSDCIAILSLVWLSAGGTRTPLRPSDSYEADLLYPSWEATAGVPALYLDYDDGTLSLRLAPLPAANGTLEGLYVALPTQARGEGVTLSIPDEFLDGVKYGTLADLLGKVGRANDLDRAQYAEERYGLTVSLSTLILNGWA